MRPSGTNYSKTAASVPYTVEIIAKLGDLHVGSICTRLDQFHPFASSREVETIMEAEPLITSYAEQSAFDGKRTPGYISASLAPTTIIHQSPSPIHRCGFSSHQASWSTMNILPVADVVCGIRELE